MGAVAGWLKKGAKHAINVGSAAKENPLLSLVVLVGILGLFVYIIRRNEVGYRAVDNKIE